MYTTSSFAPETINPKCVIEPDPDHLLRPQVPVHTAHEGAMSLCYTPEVARQIGAVVVVCQTVVISRKRFRK
jgi:hypothetical protein